MLIFRSIDLSRARIAAWEDERRNSLREDTVRRFTFVTIGADLGDRRPETVGAEGTTGTAMLGGGGGGILAALPMPLGSFTELFRPPALPGPLGMPLTPASCAKDAMGAICVTENAKAKNADLPNIDHPPVRQCNDPAGLLFLHPTRGMISRSGSSLPAGVDIAALLARGLFQGAILAEISQFSIVTYERRPGYWRAAITPVKRSGTAILGKTTSSFVTPDDFDSETDAKFAAEKMIRKL
jgi:hypothetical protein